MKLYTQTAEDGVIAARFVYNGKPEITGFRICFSLLSKCTTVSGCRIEHQLGGYTELMKASLQQKEVGSWLLVLGLR